MEREYNNKLQAFEQELSRLKKVSELLANASQIADNSVQASQTITESFKILITTVDKFIEEEKSELSRLKSATNENITLLTDSFKVKVNELNQFVDKNIKTLIDTDKAELINISDKQINQLRVISNEIKKSQQELDVNLREKIQDIAHKFENKQTEAQNNINETIKDSNENIKTKNEELNNLLIEQFSKYQDENRKQIKQLKTIGILIIMLIVGLGIYVMIK